MASYANREIERKWQAKWKSEKTFKCTVTDTKQPHWYVLDMFPYPSGVGLHVGHPKGYVATDVVARFRHANGYNVLHTMGWDAFGLPAENYAIKTGTHPRVTTEKNVQRYREQLESFGFSYDWDREINTTDPQYYRWSQWIFSRLFEHGLAFEQDLPINYCPSCKTGLANEEVVGDNECDRCGTKVERRKLRQWVLKITAYADRLLEDIDGLAWPEGIKEMQRNWIGKSEGAQFSMQSTTSDVKLSVYTTRIDTVNGMTYAVIAPDHTDVQKWITESERAVCEAYIEASKSKSDLDRTGSKEKTGVFSGSHVINPFNGESIPVYLGDYVLGSYGTGAVMAVPAHDERDFAFAKKMGLPIRQSVDVGIPFSDEAWNEAYAADGTVSVDGATITSDEARKILVTKAASEGFGSVKTNYKLRDWLFSRQRYWGEPIPLVHLDIADIKKLPHITSLEQATDSNLAYILKRDARSDEEGCTTGATCHGKVRVLVIGGKEYSRIYDGLYSKIVCDPKLPLELPEVERYEPAGDGQSPLATVDSFVNVRLASNLEGKRETNTMPQWAGSCWYYLRFMDPANPDSIASKEALSYWKNVDEYVGGAEHAVLHLLYARFWHKFLFDLGIVPTNEPFSQLMSPGLILGADGNKMSKSKGNVVNPDDVIAEHGSDTFRLYEMSMSDFRDPAPWSTNAIAGVARFLDKAYALFEKDERRPNIDDMKILRLLHKTIKKVGDDIGSYKFNTAISAMMILLNEGLPNDGDARAFWKESFVTLLHPFAPHLAEELWEKMGKSGSVYQAKWPEYQPFMLVDDEVTIAVQVNGKLRGTYQFMNGVSQEEVSLVVNENEEIRKWTEGKTIVREIFVPNKLLNIVVKDN